MDLQQIIDLVVSNGIGVACIIYFMFRDYKFMNALQESLHSLNDSVTLIREYFLNENGVDKS